MRLTGMQLVEVVFCFTSVVFPVWTVGHYNTIDNFLHTTFNSVCNKYFLISPETLQKFFCYVVDH